MIYEQEQDRMSNIYNHYHDAYRLGRNMGSLIICLRQYQGGEINKAVMQWTWLQYEFWNAKLESIAGITRDEIFD